MGWAKLLLEFSQAICMAATYVRSNVMRVLLLLWLVVNSNMASLSNNLFPLPSCIAFDSDAVDAVKIFIRQFLQIYAFEWADLRSSSIIAP